MPQHDGNHMNVQKPRILPSLNYGALLQAGTMIAVAVAVVVTIRVQQQYTLERLQAMQDQFASSLDAQISLVNSRVDLVRAELEGKIAANEARIDNQERLLSADISRIREMLEDLTDRFDRQDRMDR